MISSTTTSLVYKSIHPLQRSCFDLFGPNYIFGGELFFFYWPPKRDGNANVNAYKTDLIERTYRHDTCQNFTEANFKKTRKFTRRTRKLSHFWHSETPFLALKSSSNQGDQGWKDGTTSAALSAT